MLTIIDYGVGNLASIKNMLKKIGFRDACISSNSDDLLAADKLILPGVGHFDYGMNSLKNSGLLDTLNQCVLEQKTPLLGICLGAQLLTKSSEEGDIPGLGYINAKTVSFDKSKMPDSYRIPHMSWGDVDAKPSCKLFYGMYPDPRFYFVHSYHLVCEEENDAVAHTDYGYRFVAGFEKDNVIGMQFHPEKSHKFGMKLLENYIKHY